MSLGFFFLFFYFLSQFDRIPYKESIACSNMLMKPLSPPPIISFWKSLQTNNDCLV